MKTYARIENGLVAELFETDGDIAGMFHPDMRWVDVTAASPSPAVGWSMANGQFSEPVTIPPNGNATILAQIASIEAATLVPRVTREFMMRVAEKDAAASGADLSHDAAYQRVKAVDDQISALRARLK